MLLAISTRRNGERARAGRFELPRDGTLRLRSGSEGLRLRVERGVLLVTREGDGDDHVVTAGRELLVTGPGLVVAWALEQASIAVQRAPAGAPAHGQPALASSL
ncbi:MAG TPA: DUF2917 domain-containing protein [Anaeromyxobacteraceae bacterium]|nr:DUF2917 domain-containing protein [Anaeromyxobacteraceae bacterium]